MAKRKQVTDLVAEKEVPEDVIITYDGSPADKKKCKYITGEYYRIGDKRKRNSGQCYLLDVSEETEKYVRTNSKFLIFNFSAGMYMHTKDSRLREYVVGIAAVDKKNKAVIGAFTPVPSEVIPAYTNTGVVPAKNETILKKLKYIESLYDGNFYDPSILSSEQTRNHTEKGLNWPTKSNYPEFSMSAYGASKNKPYAEMVTNSRNYKDLFTDTTNNVFTKILGQYTIGVEFETKSGHIPSRFLYKAGLVPVKDGSIRGHEYITVPFSPQETGRRLTMATKLLQKYTSVDQYCSLHVHLGNTHRDEKFIVSLYYLILNIQEELLEMVPPYKTDIAFLANKPGGALDHCKRLHPLGLRDLNFANCANDIDRGVLLDRAFKQIFKFVNEGLDEDPQTNRHNKRHSRQDLDKWHLLNRYYLINFMNVLFKKTNQTLEFRLHHATNNKYKLLNWVAICAAVLRYAENNQDLILDRELKINLKDVISDLKNYIDHPNIEFACSYLNDYIISRKETFCNNFLGRNIEVHEEFFNDDKYTFKTKNNKNRNTYPFNF